MKFFYPYFWVLILFSFTVFAKEQKNIIKSISYTKQETNKNYLSLKDWQSLKDPKISYKNGVYWFKVVLNPSVNEYEKLVFSVNEPSISSIEVFDIEKLITTHKSTIGKLFINFEISPSNQSVYFLRVNFTRQVHFPLKVYSRKDFNNYKTNTFLKIGLYYGLTLMVLIINLAFYISLKNKTFLYYALFLISINLSLVFLDGIAHFLILPQNSNLLITIFHYLITVFGVLFASNYLNLHSNQPKAHKIGRWFLSLNAMFSFVYLFNNHFLYGAIADVLSFSILIYYWSLGILSIKKHSFAIFFVIGYSMILMSGITYLIPLNFGLSNISITLNHVKFGAIFEMLVLTYAITFRMKKMQEENELYIHHIKKYISRFYDLKKALENQKNNETNKSKETLSLKIKKLTENYSLTEREVEVLLKITEGLTNKEIAETLCVSINTVKYHTKNLYEKLEIKKRTEITSKFLIS